MSFDYMVITFCCVQYALSDKDSNGFLKGGGQLKHNIARILIDFTNKNKLKYRFEIISKLQRK